MRKLAPEDALDFFKLNIDEEVLRYTGDQPFESLAAAKDFLNNYDQYERFGVGRLAVIDQSTKQFMGWCGLRYSLEKNEYDIGFRFFKKYWNQGFATETAKKCIDFGFSELNIDRVVGRAMNQNLASIKVLEKIGMKFKENITFEEQVGCLYELKNQFTRTD